MRKDLFIKIILLLVLILVLCSCAKKGSEFVGKWKSISNPSEKIEIIANGENFLVRIAGKEIPATYNNGNLEIKTYQLGMETVDISYIEKDDKLSLPGFRGQEYFVRDN